MRNFIRLRSDDGSLDFAFKVVMGTWKPEIARTQTRRRTVTGVADTAEGVAIKSFNGVILCSASPRSGFDTVYLDTNGEPATSGCPLQVGTLDNLTSLFSLNDPSSSSQSSALWLYDFTTSYVGGSYFTVPPDITKTHLVEFVGKLPPESLSPMMVGTEAQYTVAISMEQIHT
jgi:hypothetical protein